MAYELTNSKIGLIYSNFIDNGKFMNYGNDASPEQNEHTIFRLIKTQNQQFTILEIANANDVLKEELKVNMESSGDMLYGSRGTAVMHLYKIYVFDYLPPEDVFSLVRNSQFNDVARSRYLSCYFVIASSNTVYKLFESFLKSVEIDQILEDSVGHVDKEPDAKISVDPALRQSFSMIVGDEDGNFDDIKNIVKKKRNDIPKLTIKAKVSYYSFMFIAINLGIFAIMKLIAIWGSSFLGENANSEYVYIALLNIFGDKDNQRIIVDGQYWRFITPMFLHGNLLHVFFNSYSIHSLAIVEKLYGNKKFLYIYMVSGVVGCIASFAFNNARSVGASGAVFGLLGAIIYFGQEKPEQFRQYFGVGVIITLLLNFAIGYTSNNIDNFAHLGGLVGGFFAAGTMGVDERKRDPKVGVMFLLGTIAIMAAGILYGFSG